ncbi:MAG: hypothetical protein KDA75_22460, partial [Planctomycetaceae bacterium]|nr:hypothetical protein [Planctomycetaceae bacterium]
DEDAASALCSHTASGLNQKTHHTVPAVTGHARWGDAGAGTSAIGLVASLLTLGRAQLFGVRSAVADEPGSPLRWILHGGEPAGETCLKLGRLGNRQATGVALARVPA